MANMNPMSDNFVTGDNMYLRELQNFFFEVLGMMSITHYGAIGDGRTDNYPYLQVAIDDANRRGLNYLYVPYGIYRYRGELQNIGDLAFYGNPRARIINDSTGEEITVEQFGVTGGGTTNYNNLQNKPTLNGTTIQGNKYSLDYNLQGKLTAGDGITINAHNVISATGGGGGGIEITTLEENLIIKDGVAPTLGEGFYYTGPYNVIWKNGDESQTKTVLDDYEIFYYNANAETIFTPAFQCYYTADTDKWMKDLNCFNTDEIVDDNYLIPTSKAVYNALKTSIVTATLAADYTLTDTLERLALSSYASTGTKLTIDANGRIVVGSGVSYVKVSAQITFGLVTDGTKDLVISVGSKTRVLNSKPISVGNEKTICCASFIVPVEEGDKVFLKAGGAVGDEVKSYYDQSLYTYLTVEAIS